MLFSYKDWNNFSYFFSASSTQNFLKKNYNELQIENPEQKSYENCYRFLYYLEHAKVYYEQADKSPLMIKPVLLFYGLIHLIKACILTTDPNYPETTAVLAHGVSTRKRKKQHYSFFQDEVKFQRSGLFPLMVEKMFHMKHLEGDKATMGDLLKQIPELSELFMQFRGEETFLKISMQDGHYLIPKKILDSFHMTENRFIEFYQSRSAVQASFIEREGDFFELDLEMKSNYEPAPIKFNLWDGCYSLPLKKNSLFHFPELLIHYLLLYNLSMISRYETEWWSELIKMMPNQDYPLIQSFLNISMEKTPFLIYQFLNSKR